jgi:hypothetical protein
VNLKLFSVSQHDFLQVSFCTDGNPPTVLVDRIHIQQVRVNVLRMRARRWRPVHIVKRLQSFAVRVVSEFRCWEDLYPLFSPPSFGHAT